MFNHQTCTQIAQFPLVFQLYRTLVSQSVTPHTKPFVNELLKDRTPTSEQMLELRWSLSAGTWSSLASF